MALVSVVEHFKNVEIVYQSGSMLKFCMFEFYVSINLNVKLFCIFRDCHQVFIDKWKLWHIVGTR